MIGLGRACLRARFEHSRAISFTCCSGGVVVCLLPVRLEGCGAQQDNSDDAI